jgi:hypothetical protein
MRSFTNVALAHQAFDQGGSENLLSCPQMVCPCGLSFPPGPSLPSGVGLGFLNFLAMRRWVLRDKYAIGTEKFTISSRLASKFLKICAIMPSTKQDAYKRGSLSRLNSERAVAKAVFGIDWSRSPHNLGFIHIAKGGFDQCQNLKNDPLVRN